MNRKTAKFIYIFLAILIFIVLFLFLIRAFSERELDDVSPEIICKEKLMQKSDILWVIPEFNNKSISENKEWCKEILSLNKTIGMHGVTHIYREFEKERSQEYLEEGIKIFEECFGYKPTMFKPPQLRISKENKKLIEENNLLLKAWINQIARKVYHCGEYGEKRNWIIGVF